MNLCAESSAVLAWLLGEPKARAVRRELRRAKLVLASDLTLIECDRVLLRAAAGGDLSEGRAADLSGRLERVAQHWTLLRCDQEIVERARRPFPREPWRTLDALHLATAAVARSLVPGLALLSLDRRIRASGAALGFDVLPE